MTTPAPEKVIGVAWYDPAQWNLLLRIAADRADLDQTYSAWERNALDAERTIKEAGHEVVRVPVDVAKLAPWCRKKGLPNSSSSRAQYVAQTMQQSNKAGV